MDSGRTLGVLMMSLEKDQITNAQTKHKTHTTHGTWHLQFFILPSGVCNAPDARKTCDGYSYLWYKQYVSYVRMCTSNTYLAWWGSIIRMHIVYINIFIITFTIYNEDRKGWGLICRCPLKMRSRQRHHFFLNIRLGCHQSHRRNQ